MHCTNCGKELENGLSFCPNCGQKVPSGTSAAALTCHHCGRTLLSGTKFCPACGHRTTSSSSKFEDKNFLASSAGMVVHIMMAIVAFIGAYYLYSMGNDIPFYLKDQKHAMTFLTIFLILTGLEECYAAYLSQQVYLVLREQQIDFGYMVSFPLPRIKRDSVSYKDIQDIKIAGTSNLIIRSFEKKYSLLIKNAEEAKLLIDMHMHQG